MVAFARQQVHLTSRTHTTGCIALVHKPQRSVLQSVFFCHSGRLRLLGRVAKHGRRRRHHELGDRRRGQPRLSAGGEQMHTGQQVSSRRACLFLLNPSPWYRRPHVFALRVCDQRRRSKRTHVRSAASLRRQACLWDCHRGSRGGALRSNSHSVPHRRRQLTLFSFVRRRLRLPLATGPSTGTIHGKRRRRLRRSSAPASSCLFGTRSALASRPSAPVGSRGFSTSRSASPSPTSSRPGSPSLAPASSRRFASASAGTPARARATLAGRTMDFWNAPPRAAPRTPASIS